MLSRKRVVVCVAACCAALAGVAFGALQGGLVDVDGSGLVPPADVVEPDVGAAAGWGDVVVEATGNEANADPGGVGNANLLIVVTYQGVPVSDLEASDFQVRTILVPPGGWAVTVTETSNYGSGAYALKVTPHGAGQWLAGKYDSQILVKSTATTIASFVVH